MCHVHYNFFFMRAIKPWDKDALIRILIDEGAFGIVFHLIILKDYIMQVCSMKQIGALPLTLYVM